MDVDVNMDVDVEVDMDHSKTTTTTTVSSLLIFLLPTNSDFVFDDDEYQLIQQWYQIIGREEFIILR